MTRLPFGIEGPFRAKRNPTKRYVAIAIAVAAGAAVLLLSGCSTPPYNPLTASGKQNLVIDKEVQPMTRNEVVTAIGDCQSNNLRAVLIYAKRNVNNYTSEVVIDVTCAPKY